MKVRNSKRQEQGKLDRKRKNIGGVRYGTIIKLIGILYRNSQMEPMCGRTILSCPCLRRRQECSHQSEASRRHLLAECAFFLIDHDAFREISIKNIKRLMASPVIVDGKNLFACEEDGVVYTAIGKGEMLS